MEIRKHRESKRMTQVELATQLGTSRTTISMWETGRSKPRAGVLIRLAEILGCTVDELLGIEKTPAEQRT